MLIGRAIFENKSLNVLYDKDEKKVYELLSTVSEVFKNSEEIDIDPKGIEIDKVKIDIPITPSKIICVGRNYKAHAEELGNEVPPEPILFLKPPSSLLPHKGVIHYPALTNHVDFEGELALIIKRRITKEKALEIRKRPEEYFAWTAFLDITARDLQKKDKLWTRAKGFDTFGPIGPWIELDEPVERLTIQTRVNGELKQNSTTDKMIFPPAELIEYISAVMTLEQGDIIATGTPEGVGKINKGDTIELKIGAMPKLVATVGY